MKCQNANSYFLYLLATVTLFFTFMAHARIENTVIANYDLNSGKNAHYALIMSPQDKNTALTLVPLDQNNKAPSTFKISACINRYAGLSKQGEFHLAMRKPIKMTFAYQISVPLLLNTICMPGGFI